MKPSLSSHLMPRLLIVAGALLMSCTPADAPTAVRSGVRPQSGNADDQFLGVFDNDRNYLLDLRNNLFTTSDGDSITLDPSVTLEVAAMMQGITTTDWTASDLYQVATGVLYSNAGGGDCTSTGTCQTLRAGDGPAAPPAGRPAAHQRRVKPFHMRIRRGGARRRRDVVFNYADTSLVPAGPLLGGIPVHRPESLPSSMQRSLAPQGFRLNLAPGAPGVRHVTMAPSADYGDVGGPCADVLNAALGSTRHWSEVRTTPLSKFTMEVRGAARDYALDHVTAGWWSLFKLELDGLDLINTQLSVGVLALYWNSNNCWTQWALGRPILAGPVVMLLDDEFYIPGMKVTCKYEDVQWTFDDVRYFTISTKICEIDYT